jgi:PPK2 family polyphosphate:nucleotide phosphotransferase
MNLHRRFAVEPGTKLRLAGIDPSQTGRHESRKKAEPILREQIALMAKLQNRLYASATRSLLIVLQGLDAAGKDGAIRHVFSGMNPQGVDVYSFKEPTPAERAHDFLWRVHRCVPGRGEVVIFNRSHYEDVLIARVHDLVPKSVWSKRYRQINDFEKMLTDSGTTILKFYLHISPEEQLDRFRDRLDDPASQWKISTSDYTERELWPKYIHAYEKAIEKTSTDWAPWYVIPANHKWFRNLALSEIIAETMQAMDLDMPAPRVDLTEIRRKYHAAATKSGT